MKKLITLLIAITLLLTGCISIEFDEPVVDSSSGNNFHNSNIKADEIEKQITVKLVETDSIDWHGVGVLLTNNSPETIGDLEIQLLFYNESNNVISADSCYHRSVLPGSTVVSYIEAPNSYAKYDYNLVLDVDTYSFENLAKDIEVKTNIGDECIILHITNNANDTINELQYAVVFYKDEKIVDVTNGIDLGKDIDAGETIIEECSTWETNYDSYTVYINHAYCY